MSRKQPLSRWLSQYRPAPGPGYEQKIKNAPWMLGAEKAYRPRARSLPGWQAAAALGLAMLILAVSIPAVRASLSAWLGLSVAPSNQMPAAAVTLAAVTPATQVETPPAVTQAAPAPAVSETTTAVDRPALPPEIAQLSLQAGWDVLAPTLLPEGYRFQSAYFDTNHKMALLTYTVTRQLPGSTDPALTETKSMTVLQARQNDFVPMQIAPATSVSDVQVNGRPAAYAPGAWDSEFVKDEKDPNGGKMISTWRAELAVQNLYWQVGDIYLVLVSDDPLLRQQDLIETAASFSQP